jgi:protein subunit release factor B
MPHLSICRLSSLLRIRAQIPSTTALPRHARPSDRSFSSTLLLAAKPLPPRRPILDSEIIESFLKGSGPGGQKINKTSSAVQLKHLPTGIVVKCQETRSRSQNRKFARRLLQERIEEMELGDEARTRVKGREIAGRKKSADKKKRRKYRALGEGKAEAEEEEGEGDEGAEVREHADSRAVEEDTRSEGAGKAG